MQRDPSAAPRPAQFEHGHIEHCHFEFVDDPPRHAPAGARVVRIGRGVKSKRALLAIYAEALRLPDYFGWNWDALEECLRDLSWLDSSASAPGAENLPTPVAIVHEAIPLRCGSSDRQSYLQLLNDLVRQPPASGRALTVLFPANSRAKIESCLS